MTIPRGTPGAGSVDSVNGDPGPDIVLDATDVGARPATWVPDWTDLTGKPSTFAPSAHTHAESEITGLTADLAAKVPTSSVGAANGVAPLGSDAKVPAAYLPSYVDDVLEYANLAGFPGTGETGKIYVADDTGKIYRWSGSAYIEISPSPGSTDSVVEGSTNLYFTNARAQAALSSALSAKQDTSAKGVANGYASLGSDGLVPSSQLPASTSSAPLARTTYNFTAGSTTTLTAASTTATSDADASNLAVTFTVPTSGKVRVSLEATIAATSSSGWVYWSLRNGTTDVVGSERFVALPVSTTGRFRLRVEIPLSGLTSGASLTYKWALRGSGVNLGIGNVGEFSNANNNYGPAIMTVFAE